MKNSQTDILNIIHVVENNENNIPTLLIIVFFRVPRSFRLAAISSAMRHLCLCTPEDQCYTQLGAESPNDSLHPAMTGTQK